jgi:flagellar operon protein
MNGIRGVPPSGLIPHPPHPAPRTAPAVRGPGFAQVLREQVTRGQGLRFSAHAQERLTERNIELSAADLSRLNEAVQEISAKGGREALLLLEKAALVVSVRNSTVITALGTSELNSHIFTNIDSAVVIPSAGSPHTTTS